MSLAEQHRLLESVDVAALVDCGCNVYVWKDGSGAEIDFCALHSSAQDLVDSLQSILDSNAKPVYGIGGKEIKGFTLYLPLDRYKASLQSILLASGRK